MKNIVIVAFSLMTLLSFGQNLKTYTSHASASDKVLNESSLVHNLANDQVKKLTKKLNLSETQQQQVSNLVESQLKREKFQKLIGQYSPNEKLGEDARDQLYETLLADDTFKSNLASLLNSNQQTKLLSSMSKGG